MKISNDQRQFLQAAATLAYGSGRNEKTEGGKGHMALMSDANGNMRIIKCNTHFSHAEKVQSQINSSEQARNLRESLIAGSSNLRGKLADIGRTLGMKEDRISQLLGDQIGDRNTLLTRKVVARFVNAAIAEEGKDNADAKLGGIWNEASRRAVKSEFSMTFEKVSASTATDFHGSIDRSNMLQSAQKLKEINATLGSGENGEILELAEKIEQGKLLEPTEERRVTRLLNLHNSIDLFSMNNVEQLTRNVFACYGCDPTDDDLRAVSDMCGVVFQDVLADETINSGDAIAAKLDKAVKDKVHSLIMNGDRLVDDVIRPIISDKYDNNMFLYDLAPELVSDKGFQDGLAELLSHPSGTAKDDFETLVSNRIRDIALKSTERELFDSVYDPVNNAKGKNKLTDDVREFLIKQNPSEEEIKSFQLKYTEMSAHYNRSMALNGQSTTPIEEIKNLISIRNLFNDRQIILKDAPRFFSADILDKCSQLGEALKKNELRNVGERLATLTAAVRNNRSRENVVALNKFLLYLCRAGLCNNGEIINHIKTKKVQTSWQKSIDRYIDDLRNLSDSEKVDVRKLLMKKLAEDVFDKVLLADKVETGDLDKKVTDAFARYVNPGKGKPAFSPLKEQAEGVMAKVNGFENVIGMLSRGSQNRTMEVNARGRKRNLKNEFTGNKYTCTDVHPGAYLGNNYVEQSCQFHSVLKGLGVDVTRNNGLILRKAVAKYIEHCLSMAPKDKLEALKNIRQPKVSDFVKLFNGQFKSPHDGFGVDAVSLNDLKEGRLPTNFLSPTSAMDDTYIPFLASMLKRPIVLELAEGIGVDGAYQSIMQEICDVDILTGQTIVSSEPPITIMMFDGHYQFLDQGAV